MANYRLTEEQRQFAENNHDLLLAFIGRNHLDCEYWYPILAERYCICVHLFDPSKGASFSTYLYSSLKLALYQDYRSNNTQRRKLNHSLVSLNTEIPGNDESACELSDITEDTYHKGFDSFLCARDVLNDIITNLFNDRDSQIIKFLLAGYTQEEVAAHFEIKQATVSRVLSRFKEVCFDEIVKGKRSERRQRYNSKLDKESNLTATDSQSLDKQKVVRGRPTKQIININTGQMWSGSRECAEYYYTTDATVRRWIREGTRGLEYIK